MLDQIHAPFREREIILFVGAFSFSFCFFLDLFSLWFFFWDNPKTITLLHFVHLYKRTKIRRFNVFLEKIITFGTMDVKKFAAITSGFVNFVFPTEYFEKLAISRAEECSMCPHANPEHPFKKWTPEDNKTEIISGMGCNLCGCLLSAKVRQNLEKCPDDRW